MITIVNRGDDPVVVVGADGRRTDLGAGSVADNIPVPARVMPFGMQLEETVQPFDMPNPPGTAAEPRNDPVAGRVLTFADSLADLRGLPRPGSEHETAATAEQLAALVQAVEQDAQFV